MTTIPQDPRRYKGVMARPGDPLSVLTPKEQWLVVLGLLAPLMLIVLGFLL